MSHNLFGSLTEFGAGGRKGLLYSLPALEAAGIGAISRLPVCIRILLESVLRNFDGKRITEEHVRRLANWKPDAFRTEEIPFVVARILLQDFTGVPLLCDLAAMRGAVSRTGGDPAMIEPLVPVDLVVDHSVQVDYYGVPDALERNMELEFRRNRERYRFLKWGMKAFNRFKVVPPGIGIVHQVNLEFLARGVVCNNGTYYPDTLVGTDSHTTMINGVGVVGWGVGGIEAEAGMLGQPVYILTPDVVGVNITGRLSEGVTATDLVLTVTEMLRREKVVGKFVEFFGDGVSSLTVPDRATVANMAPEYGATIGFFPVDEVTVDFFRMSGRSPDEVSAFEAYFRAQNMFGIPSSGKVDYSGVLELDLSRIEPSVAGPKRPQDRAKLSNLGKSFAELYSRPSSESGFGRKSVELAKRFPAGEGTDIGSGDIVIAAITSCTNTSNPYVMLAAGLLARKAVERGLSVKRHVKTSLAPGSRVVTEYLGKSGLLPYLEKLGFSLAAYGCTTCIGNSGQLDGGIEEAIVRNELVCASVLSGNRNFEARIHPNIRANYLMSPPLVVAFAIAGTILKDIAKEPLGTGSNGELVYLKDVWPSNAEIEGVMKYAADPRSFRRLYSDLTMDNALWNNIGSVSGGLYNWEESTYIAEPPFFQDFRRDFIAPHSGTRNNITGARSLAIFGNSLTTDHISPAGSIKEDSPAGRYLKEKGVAKEDFQSYGTRRGNHEVMVRGTFANVRIRNLMVPLRNNGSPVEGGVTLYQPSGEEMSVYDAAMRYIAEGIPTVVFAGEEYGTGSSRDWAAKGPRLLGVKAVIARSFERIHRSNLIGMGILPLQFKGEDSVQSLNIKGDEEFDILGLERPVPRQGVVLVIRNRDGGVREIGVLSRIDTPVEVEYYLNGGILPFVLRGLMGKK